MQNKVPGVIRDIRFKNVTIEGKPGAYKVQIEGADAQHDVRGVTLENVTILGQKLAPGSERVKIGPNTEGITVR
jgi:hypothetical protein